MLEKFSHHQLKHILARSPSEELCAASLVCPFPARESPPKSGSLGCLTLWLKSSITWLLAHSLSELCFIRRPNKRNCAMLVFSIAPFETNINHMGQRSTLPMSNKPTVLFHLQRRKMGFEYYHISTKLSSNEA